MTEWLPLSEPYDEPRSAAYRPETLVHAAADANVPVIGVAIRYAFAKGRQALGDPPDPAKAAAAVRAALLDVLPAALVKAVTAGGAAGATLLASQLKAAGDFRGAAPAPFFANDQAVTAWAKAHATMVADIVAQTTRDDVTSALEGIFNAEYIKSSVGDQSRADMIARTEAMTAANEGQRQSWRQAVERGFLSGTEQREWIATGDDGVCDECDALDGQTTDLDGEYPDDGGEGPPLHPNCRCTEGISTQE